MKMVSTEELSDRAVIACIQIDNNNKTMWKFQAEQIEGLEHRGFKKLGRKQAQNRVKQVKLWREGRRTHK